MSFDRRTLLSLTAATATAYALSSSQALAKDGDALKLSNPAALKGVTSAVLGAFAVAFVTERKDVAKAGGGLMGSGFGGKSSASSTLMGLTDADFQAATDAAYDIFVQKLASAGITLADREGLMQTYTKAKVKPFENGRVRDLVYGRDDRGKVRVFAPTQQTGGALMPREWLGMITNSGITENGSSINVSFGAQGYAKSSKTPVIAALIMVDFANAETYGGFHRNSSAIKVDSSLAAWPELTQINIYAPNGKIGTAALNTPVALGGAYGTFADATSGGHKTAEAVANVVGVLGGIGSNKSRKYVMDADPAKWREGVGNLSNEAITTLLTGLT